MCVNDLFDGLERTNDKLPGIGSGRAIFNAVNAKADWLSVSTGFLSFDYIAKQEIAAPATVFESLTLRVCIDDGFGC